MIGLGSLYIVTLDVIIHDVFVRVEKHVLILSNVFLP